jgi:hypothetical protein
MNIFQIPDDKVYSDKSRSKDNSLPVTIVQVTECPSSPDHASCSQMYVDITQRYAVECICKCHETRDESVLKMTGEMTAKMRGIKGLKEG